MPIIRKPKPMDPAGAPLQPQSTRTPGHVNLSELLGLNADKGAQMGGALVSAAGQQGYDAKKALGQAQANFTQQKNAGTVNYEARRSKAEAEKGAQGVYSGPTQLQQVAPTLGTQVHDAADAVQRVGTQQGRASLLQQQVKQSGYGAGASAFDSYLAGKGAEPQMHALQSQYGDLAGLLGVEEGNASNAADAAKAASADAAGKYAADLAPAQRQLRSQSAAEDEALTRAHNADLRGQQGKDRISGGDRLQQSSDLDWMLKSGRITQADYSRALDNPQYFQSLMAQHG